MGAEFDEHLALRALQPLRDCFLHARVQPIREVFRVLGSPQLRDVGQPGTQRRRDLFAALETRLIELDHAAEVGPRPPSSDKDEKQEHLSTTTVTTATTTTSPATPVFVRRNPRAPLPLRL